MKKIYFLLLALGLFGGVEAQIINIPDANFKGRLLSASPTNTIAKNLAGDYFKIDANNDMQIQQSEALEVSYLDVHDPSYINRLNQIFNLTGIEYFTNLGYLDCSYNSLMSLNMSSNTILTSLNCEFNYLASLEVSSNIALTSLDCSSNSLTNLNVSGNTGLTGLDCSINQLTSLNMGSNTVLTSLNCSSNRLTILNVSGNTALTSLFCNSNRLPSLNVSSNTALTSLFCNSNQLTSLNVSSNTALTILNCRFNQIMSLNMSSNTVLADLNCGNNILSSLNMSSNTALTSLFCFSNQLTSLNVSNNTALTSLVCSSNQLPSLNVSNNTALTSLDCSYNQLPSLNVSNNTALTSLDCSTNALTSLNVNSNTALNILKCSYNQLPSLNVSSNTALNELYCDHNKLTSLNVNSNAALSKLYCDHNLLISLFIKNGYSYSDFLSLGDNPTLQYICTDESQITNVRSRLDAFSYTNCQVNSYCTFSPGGTFYTIRGNNKYDGNNNGCNALDLPLSNLKINITNGTNAGSLISNTSGSYAIPVQAGTHTLTPAFENPTYFTASPSPVNVTFPTQTSPFTQNFCITANGAHPDLEIVLLPINAARPGFDVKYKLVYKNKGTAAQSGTVNILFNDAVLDFISAIPVVANQTVNNLSWNFTDLLPFETREITLILSLNSPMEIPAVNAGTILNYTAAITSAAIDDLPNDNTFVFHQTAVNSFDPNDKTCLEGATISPAKVGDYVHYMIRFENNGTANAQNIVVKDMINTAKFDVSSIVPMKGSHSFVTNITSGNKVEFIFENINLPFDDANNDGYVAFKIKTKPTLVSGNTFSNTASIYFDYNFPIVTNTATTTIAALAVKDFEFSNYFNVYPNPVHDVLHISAKESIEISSITIFNTLGQLVLVIPNAKEVKAVDVSNLVSGNYFIKIQSDKGTSNTKFIKD